MVRSAIIWVMLNYCAFLCAQNYTYSRKFESPKKNFPVQIINNATRSFYVLRQNKAIHDMTIERRSKSTFEILAFTPLKLDSVNANWFDYENLDYLLFEADQTCYFLFEKVLNTKKTIYLKVIDSLGKSSGFIELASLEKDKQCVNFGFIYKKTVNNNILLVGYRTDLSGIKRNTAVLYSTKKKEVIWFKRLAPENAATISSHNFDCDEQNNLIYLQNVYEVLGYQTYYASSGNYSLPQIQLDSINFHSISSLGNEHEYMKLNLHEFSAIKSSYAFVCKESIVLTVQGLREDTVKRVTEELVINFIKNDKASSFKKSVNAFDPYIKKQLTFYDGPVKQYYFKSHELKENYYSTQSLYSQLERNDENYFKEIVLRKTDLSTGEMIYQKVVPRKILFFRSQSRYRNIATVMSSLHADTLRLVLLENPNNFRRDQNVFSYHDFRKETNVYGSNIVAYRVDGNGRLLKELVFHNADFDLVPLTYQSNQTDMLFYLNNGNFEKFLIWKPYP